MRAAVLAAVVLGAAVALGGLCFSSAAYARSQEGSAGAWYCLAQAVYFEAGGESLTSQRAVAHVVLNRARASGFPGGVCAVVRQGGEEGPCQFNWWCDGRSDRPAAGARWETAKRIARDAIRGRSQDPTGGALYFHQADLGRQAWTRELTRTARIGAHVYYR